LLPNGSSLKTLRVARPGHNVPKQPDGCRLAVRVRISEFPKGLRIG